MRFILELLRDGKHIGWMGRGIAGSSDYQVDPAIVVKSREKAVVFDQEFPGGVGSYVYDTKSPTGGWPWLSPSKNGWVGFYKAVDKSVWNCGIATEQIRQDATYPLKSSYMRWQGLAPAETDGQRLIANNSDENTMLRVKPQSAYICTTPIEHVFVLMLENRSFDHMLGYSDIEGNDAEGKGNVAERPGKRKIDGLSDQFNMANGIKYQVKKTAPRSMAADPNHEFREVMNQLCGRGARYQPGGGSILLSIIRGSPMTFART